MKLIAHYQRSHLLSALLIFLIAGSVFYLLLYRVLLFQMDEDLEIEQHEIALYVHRFGTLPQNVLPVEDQMVSYAKVTAPMPKPILRTLKMRDLVEAEEGLFRQLTFTVQVGHDWYRASVSKSMEGTYVLTRRIGLAALSVIALLLFISSIINRLLLRRLWKPFYKTIQQLQGFGLEESRPLNLPPVRIEEFNLLNATLNAVADKAMKDYTLLKEFTENGAHELQTPLAVVRAKLDLLIQDTQMSDRQSKGIEGAYAALARMTHLNQSLLQLARIESGQYKKRIMVDIEALLTEKSSLLEEMLLEKSITTDFHTTKSIVWMHPALADMLLNNLLINAIQHNVQGGRIILRLTQEKLSICNTSAQGALREETLFSRFAQLGSTTGGTGLGLAISHQICKASGCALTYHHTREGLHCFTVTWGTAHAIL